MQRLTEKNYDSTSNEKHYKLIGCPEECDKKCYGCFVIMNVIDCMGELEDDVEDFENGFKHSDK